MVCSVYLDGPLGKLNSEMFVDNQSSSQWLQINADHNEAICFWGCSHLISVM